MGGHNGRVRQAPDAAGNGAPLDPRSYYDLSIIPSKAVFMPASEDITGQVILDLRRPFSRPGIIVIALDGKESFEYVPQTGSRSSTPPASSHHGVGLSSPRNVQRNEHKFLREREVLAQFTNISAGRHVFNFNFSLTGNMSRVPPSVSIFQELKGQGILDLKCQYKVGVSIYETSNRVEKIAKVEFPILIKDSPTTQQRSVRRNFIEMGQSEVISTCLSGLGQRGICSF